MTRVQSLRAPFESVAPLTIGLEEEVFLLDRQSLDLAPCALDVLAELGGDARFKAELPAAQIEILTEPSRCVADAVRVLADARTALAAVCAERVMPMSSGVHPFASAEGKLNRGERYDRIAEKYAPIARLQLVSALHVHVAVGGADRTLAVYDALRSYLPELAALAANSPFYAGRDTGLASVRPKIGQAMPRHGVPPRIDSWSSFAEELRWGSASRALPDNGTWWWDLRPHPGFGTLEIRVPDSQTTIAETAAVAALAHCVVAWLSARYDGGDRLPCASTWRIEENSWSACRDGVEGSMADLSSGAVTPTRDRLARLLDQLAPISERLRCSAELFHARALIDANGAIGQRATAEARGVRGVVAWLSERFCEPYPG